MEEVKMKIVAENIFNGLEGNVKLQNEKTIELSIERTDGTSYIYVGNISDFELI
jgi:hypothetical protein